MDRRSHSDSDEEKVVQKPNYLRQISKERTGLNPGKKRLSDDNPTSLQPPKSPRLEGSSRNLEKQTTNPEAERPSYEHLGNPFSRIPNDPRTKGLYQELLTNEYNELYYNSVCLQFIFPKFKQLGQYDTANALAELYLDYTDVTNKWHEFKENYQTEVKGTPRPNDQPSLDQQWNSLKKENNNSRFDHFLTRFPNWNTLRA